MLRFAIMLALLTFTIGQEYRQNQQPVAIISEQRYLSGDGKFGAAYIQEDGIHFKEETDSDGTRHGSYSYVDPTGNRRTISYTAGKNGFQPIGDHLPVAPPSPRVSSDRGNHMLPQYQPPNNNNQIRSGINDYDDGYRQQPSYISQPKSVLSNYQHNHPPPQQYQTNQFNPTTPYPERFKPPGKLSLNRTPDGFSFSFNKI